MRSKIEKVTDSLFIKASFISVFIFLALAPFTFLVQFGAMIITGNWVSRSFLDLLWMVGIRIDWGWLDYVPMSLGFLLLGGFMYISTFIMTLTDAAKTGEEIIEAEKNKKTN